MVEQMHPGPTRSSEHWRSLENVAHPLKKAKRLESVSVQQPVEEEEGLEDPEGQYEAPIQAVLPEIFLSVA